MDYPRRPSHYAHKLTRLIFKSCAAMEIGHHACMLVIHIANTEDAARYQGAVRFWNSQLMEVLGFKSPKQLNNARAAAVKAGWLVYERTNDRSVGHYWTTAPDSVSGFDDTPIDDKHSESGTRSGTRNGKPSNPSPNPSLNPSPSPNPNPKRTATSVAASNAAEITNGKRRKRKKAVRAYTPEFERFWAVYWNRKNKLAAADAFDAALEVIVEDAAIVAAVDRESAIDWLVQRTEQYARGRPETADNLHASTYLNGQRWSDELTVDRRKTEPEPARKLKDQKSW